MPKVTRAKLEKEADVLFLLKRQPALVKVLKQLDMKISPTGRLLPVPQSACPFNGCQPPFDLREFIERGAAVRRGVKAAGRKRTKPA